MTNNLKKILCLAVSGVFLLCGCENEDETVPSEITVSGTSFENENQQPFPAVSCGVKLEKAVEKAVSLSPAVTEIICEVGFRDKLVGVSDYCDFPEKLDLPKLGSTENPDLDAIIKLKPDAVFTLSLLSEREIYKLNQAGIKVLTANAPKNLEEYSAMYKEISAAFLGNALEKEQKGETMALAVGKRARAALENAAAAVELGTFVYVTEKLTVAGADTFESAVLSLSGENLCKSDGYVLPENVQPDYIIASDKLNYETLADNDVFSAMMYNGAKIVYVDAMKFERPSSRTAEIFAKLSE